MISLTKFQNSLKYFFSIIFISVFVFSFFKKNNLETAKYKGPEKFHKYKSEILGEGYYPGYRQVELDKMISRLDVVRLGQSNVQEGDNSIRYGTSAAAAATFTERGPNNVPGRTRAIVVDATDATGNTWYAGAVGGGLWKGVYASDGSGESVTWTNLTPTTVSNIAISTIAQSANDPTILYVGTGEDWSYNVDAITGDGIFKVDVSDPASPIWTNITPTSGGVIDSKYGNVSRIIVDPANKNIVLASTLKIASGNSYIFKTTNGGTSWTQVQQGNGNIQQILASPSNFNIQYAAVRGNPMLKSTDAGDNWSAVTDFSVSGYGRYELAVSHTDPNKVYSGVRKSGDQSYLYRSLDGGTSWTHITENGASGDARYTTDFWLDGQGWYDNCITVSPLDDNVVYLGGIQLFKFTVLGDNTKNSTHITDGYWDVDGKNYYVHVDHHFLTTINDGGGNFRILNGSDGGIAVSNSAADPGINHNDFFASTDGYRTTQFYGADKIKGVHAYLAGAQDNGTWYSNPAATAVASSSYTRGVGGDGLEVLSHWDNADSMIGGYQYNGFHRSLNGGTNWSYIGTTWSPHNGTGGGPFISRITGSYQDADVAYVIGDDGIYKTKDFGANWKLKIPPDIGGWSPGDVEVSMSNPRFVWASGFISGSGNLYLSKDWGNTFQAITNKPTGVGAGVSGIYSHPSEDSTVYILLSSFGRGKIFESKDLGDSWSDISGFPAGWGYGVSSASFPNVAVTSLAVMPYDTDVIWAGTDIGIVETTDRGASWSLVTNFPHVSVWDMKVRDQGEVVLATHGRGIWTATIPDLVSWEPKENLITLSVDTVNITENGGVATLTITAGKDVSPDGPITVNLAASGTAAGSEYTLSATSVTIDSTSTTKTVTVTGVDDSDQESDETVIVDISSVVNGKESGSQQVTITVKDDDGDNTPPVATLSVDNASIAEASGVSTITATLDKAPNSGNVVISLSVGGTASASDYTLSSTSITISSGTTGTATVTAIQDSDNENDETVVIDISSVSNGTESGTQQVTITITDDDAVTGIEDQGSDGLISIYPNPSSGIFKIRFNDTWKGNVDLRVLDIFGRSQYMRNIDNSSGQLEHEVDISNKSDGVFFVELSQEDKRVIKKIIKQ